ncbi:MAG TPA: chromosomal replication initiator protein DnaA [Verrucomicrobiales bacterium]|nr:chromosomal replication initiator protein DnaA [Verrucomicrobiales bacterium]HIL72533.1 chromosomal replication initiator protein DnaA [Verrucomicrobiota bacterium]
MEESKENLWESAQERLQKILNKEIYNLWFAPIQVQSLEEEIIVLEVANDFCEVWLQDNYLGLIQEVLGQLTGRRLKVQFVVSGVAEESDDKGKKSQAPSEENSRVEPVVGSEDRLSLGMSAQGFPFNPNNTFDAFVVGSENTFAHAAAMAVAKSPGKSYNPLFLYGGVGLGKTHLLHAIGHLVIANRKKARIAYVSSEKFTNEYIDAIQNHKTMAFRRKYRRMDVLLIDDIQFLSGKERIQEEFFHTFNALYEARKQIVMTCDRPASEIKNLENRLVSRFEWGLTADLQLPDFETRMAILKKKSEAMSYNLPDNVVQFLARRIRSNIRRLEGALIRVASFASLTGTDLTLDVVEDLLREVLNEESKQNVNIDQIQKKVAEHYDIRIADMKSKRRPESIAFPRQIAMFLSRQMTDHSLSAIGEAFGGRDHGTVLHACKLVKNRIEVDGKVRQGVQFLERQLMR